VVGLSLLLAMAGCGTRLNHQAVEAETAPATVSLDPASIAALRSGSTTRPAAAEPAVPSGSTVTQLPRPAAPDVGPAKPAAAGQPTSTTPSGRPPTSRRPQVAASGQTARPPQTAAATAAGSPTTTTSSQCTKPLDPVAIGQVGTFSGVAGPITGPARNALAIWAKDVNARGGLACHPVTVYSDDDGGDPARAAAEVHELVADHRVVALVANVVPLTVNGFVPALEAARIPAIGGGSSTKQDFENRWFFPEGASIDDQVTGIIHDGVELGHKRLGALYCVEASACTQADEYFKDGAKQAGAEVVYNSPVSLTQPDYTAECLNARDAKVDLFGLAVDGASIGRVTRSCAAIGYRPVIATSATLFGPDQANDPTIRSFGVVTITPDAPWFLDDQPGLRAFHQAMTTYAPNTQPTGAAVIAWASAELLRTAVDKVSDRARNGPITSELILAGLGKIQNDSLGGLTGPLTFTPDEAHATSNGCVFYELLTTAGWTAPRGSQPVCLRH
jgi:branched-chain amino acid transport system substrate-binding protein